MSERRVLQPPKCERTLASPSMAGKNRPERENPTGSFINLRLAGIEPAQPAPEADALSIRPQARISSNLISTFKIYFVLSYGFNLPKLQAFHKYLKRPCLVLSKTFYFYYAGPNNPASIADIHAEYGGIIIPSGGVSYFTLPKNPWPGAFSGKSNIEKFKNSL